LTLSCLAVSPPAVFADVLVTGVSVKTTDIRLPVGKTYKWEITVSPSNATTKGYGCSSSNPSVAAVSSDGLITAKAVGMTYITVKTASGGFQQSAIVTVSKTLAMGASTIAYEPNAAGVSNLPQSHSVIKDNGGVARFNLADKPRPSRSGYTFLGWRLNNYSSNAIRDPGAALTISTNNAASSSLHIYYAQWAADGAMATIQYNANGAGVSGLPSSHTTVKDGSGVIRFNLSAAVPSRSGYNFTGWRLYDSTAYNVDRSGQSIAFNTGTVASATTLTYYAQWAAAAGKATVQYNANGTGVSGMPGSHSVTKDASNIARFYLADVKPPPSRSGYTFAGWRLNNSTAYGVDSPGQHITIALSGKASDNSTLTYYAQWTTNPAFTASAVSPQSGTPDTIAKFTATTNVAVSKVTVQFGSVALTLSSNNGRDWAGAARFTGSSGVRNGTITAYNASGTVVATKSVSFTVLAAPAQTGPAAAYVTAGGSKLNVRSGPSTGYSVVGQFKDDLVIEVWTPSQDGFYKVRGADAATGKQISGYSSAAYITLGKKPEPVPTPQINLALADKIARLKIRDGFKTGQYWTVNGKPDGASKVFSGSKQCNGFAKEVFYELFGIKNLPYSYNIANKLYPVGNLGDTKEIAKLDKGSSRITESEAKAFFAKAQTGDMLQGRTNTGGEHTMIFLSQNGSSATFVDGNGGGGYCIINWNRVYTYANFNWQAAQLLRAK
jgi:uncharacterized repeat protein (TIGR02543 family)